MSKRIAVVDDDPDIVEVVKTLLKSKGYEVVTAPDGEDGLRLVRSTHPDLLILDLMMPKVSGLEVCRRLQEDPETRNIPIIVLSAIGEKTGKPEEFWKAGLKTDDFISKPFEPMALLGRVEYVLRQSGYVSSRNGEEGPAGGGAEQAPRPNLREAMPREIVRCFIEAWNTRDFGDEYTCLAESMRGSINQAEYVARRQQAYAEEAASPHRQNLASVVEEETTGDTARVVVSRVDSVGKRATRRREQYTLKKTDDGWKITGVRVLSK
jgi:CheY-like chemotaxis protein